MAEQYRGQFKSFSGILYTAIISNTNYSGDSQDIPHFESEGEIEISWSEVEKYDVIQGSEATVRLISESDRRFIDLYTETPGSIRLDVYKNDTPDSVDGIGSLYWSGCLDCEFYEEPYDSEKNYTVELTFTDFGILDRLKFDMTDVLPVTLESIIVKALEKSCISFSSKDESMIALNKTLSEIYIYPANFYDEDNNASSWQEVLEQILQPLSIKMIQRNGVIYFYDLHSLYNAGNDNTISWRGDNATLGVDKVFNNCKVTFSPYCVSELCSDDYDASVDTSEIGQETTHAHTFYKGYHYDSDDDYDQKLEGDKDFTLFDNPTFNGIEVVDGYPISLRKIYGGDDLDTVAHCYTLQDPASTTKTRVGSTFGGFNWWFGSTNGLMKTKLKYIPYISGNDILMRLSINAMIDVRYNPWRDASNTNCGTAYNDLHDNVKMMYMGFKARIYSNTLKTTCLYHYENLYTDGKPSLTLRGKWVAGNYSYTPSESMEHMAGLCWYNPDDLSSSIMTGNFVENYQTFGLDGFSEVDPLVASAPSGQYMPYPPCGGYLEIEINNLPGLVGIEASTWAEDFRWFLFSCPKLELVENKSPYNTIGADDIETNGIIDEKAKEDLELEFTCGTPSGKISNANGVYMDADSNQYHSFTRAGRTDTAEQLFIGTCFSQYAQRNTTLNGDVKIDTGALKAYTDPYISNRYADGVSTPTGESSKKFMMVEDVQQLSTDKSETKFVEFMKDIYTKD